MDALLLHDASFLLKNHVYSRNFRAHFGVSFVVTDTLWHILKTAGLQFGFNFQAKHLLWTLHFLKCYPLKDEGATFCGCDCKTRNKWIWLVLFTFYSTLDMVSSFFIFMVFMIYNLHIMFDRFIWKTGFLTGMK